MSDVDANGEELNLASMGAVAMRALANLLDKFVEMRKQYPEASEEETLAILSEWTEEVGPGILEVLGDVGQLEPTGLVQDLDAYCRDVDVFTEELAKLSMNASRYFLGDYRFARALFLSLTPDGPVAVLNILAALKRLMNEEGLP